MLSKLDEISRRHGLGGADSGDVAVLKARRAPCHVACFGFSIRDSFALPASKARRVEGSLVAAGADAAFARSLLLCQGLSPSSLHHLRTFFFFRTTTTTFFFRGTGGFNPRKQKLHCL